MNADQLAKLLAEYPECPKWVTERPYAEAVQLMELRRKAFPKTKPGA